MARYISTPARATGFANRCVYSTPGAYTFTVPDGVTSIKAIAVGGGAPGSTGFVDDYSEVYQIACPNASPVCNCFMCVCLDGYRCYGNGFCTDVNIQSWVRRTPFLLNKYAYAYTGAGGGYAEKDFAVTPGDSFCVTVGDQEETSSFAGTSETISATGAGAPTVTRSSAPCKCGWIRVDANGDETTTKNELCTYEQNMCTPSQASSTQWCANWCMIGTGTTCWKFAQTLDCPVTSLTSTPGCGVGGDSNYTGGASEKFSVQTIASELYVYGCPSYQDTNQNYWCAANHTYLRIFTHNFGSHSQSNCSSSAWDYILNCYSTYDDIENNCIGGACATRLECRNDCLYCGQQCFRLNVENRYDLWEGWCCNCYFMGYKMPAFKSFSADKQFLEANQGGSSSGSPLGNGCIGGIGITKFGAETETLVCQNGTSMCGTILSNCQSQWCDFFVARAYLYCNEECGFKNFNYYTCCPEVAFFDRYVPTSFPEVSADEFDKEYAPLWNLDTNDSILSANVLKFPWRNKSGCTDTCTLCSCIAFQYDTDCYWSCQGGGQCANSWSRCNYLCSCTPCSPSGCYGSAVKIGGSGLTYCCPARYCCGSGMSTLHIWTNSCCQCCNCCCSICYANLCLEGTTTNFIDAVRCQCLFCEDTDIEDLVCHITVGTPWLRDYWSSFKDCATSDTASDDFKTAWCVMCGIMNASIYHVGFHDPLKCTRNHYCSCGDSSQFNYFVRHTNCSCYCPSAVCYGASCSCIEFRCNGNVKSRVTVAIDSAAATVIPGSAGGPNAKGQVGYVLGDDEIYIAGTGADKSGTTQPQYILTSSGASMGKSIFDKIRSNYHGDLMAWYLNECWKVMCTDAATGKNNTSGFGCKQDLTNFDTMPPLCQKCFALSHYTGSSCTSSPQAPCYCTNSSCMNSTEVEYSMKLYACANAEFIRKFNLHQERPQESGIGNTTLGCERRFTVVDVGSSGGIVIAPKSKAFSGDPLCINTGGSSATTSYAVHHTTSNAGVRQGFCPSYIAWNCCGCYCGVCPDTCHEYLSACIDDNQDCKFTATWSCFFCCRFGLPYYNFNLTGNQYCDGPVSGCSFSYLETSREVGGGSSDVFTNEKYTGSTLSDEYLFDAEDPVFGGTGQICVNGTTLYSLPGLTQAGSVGGCIVKGNATQDVTQTPYSGGIFPKGTPGYGGGGTVCGEGGTGLVVVYWN